MHWFAPVTIVAGALLAGCPRAAPSALGSGGVALRLQGSWLGRMELPATSYRIRIALQDAGDRLDGFVDVPDMGLFGAPFSRATVPSPHSIELVFHHPRGTWSAGEWHVRCDASGADLACTGTFGELAFPFTLTRVELIPSSSDLAHRLAGYYELPEGRAILACVGGRLLRLDGAGIVELYPISDHEATATGHDRVRFELAPDGRASAAVFADGGSDEVRARRLDRPYALREIVFPSGRISLRGTLRVPRGAGPHPAVVLVHGSSPGTGYQDYFERIADHMAKHGVAVFAYDKRGWGFSDGDWRTATFDDLADDALSAIRAIDGVPGIDQERIGLWGISQGGWILPMVASRSPKPAFLILASASAMSPAEQERARVEHEMRADGAAPEQIAEALAFLDHFVQVAHGKAERTTLAGAIRAARGMPWASYPAVLQVGESPKAVDAIVRIAGEAPDPEAALRRVACPVLAIYGELDQTVPVEENRARLERALRAGANPDVTVITVPKADHAFFPTQTGGRVEMLHAASSRLTFAPGFLEGMTDWLVRRFVRREGPR